MSKRQTKTKSSNKKRPRYPFSVRIKAVRMYLEEGFSISLITEELGAADATLYSWIKRYEEEGEEGLKDRSMPARKGARLAKPIRQAVIDQKKEEPTWGIKRISDVLRRCLFLPVSPETVRKTLHEEGLIEKRKTPRKKNDVKPRFFERSTPNQMWQTDIMTFRLGGKNTYMIGYIDDYSRYLVGLDIFRSQTAENVIELYRRSVGEYNCPKEMLTDNGRQYHNWRGVTRFEKELIKDKVKHFRSQPHHPQTLGKIERFWQSILQEFLQKAQFDSFEQAKERIALWVKYYNFRRPHQGIGGLCPADRFFEVANELKAVIEKGVAENVLELALKGEAKTPFYMVGRFGGESVVMHAEKGKLKMAINHGEEISPQDEYSCDLNNLKEINNDEETGYGPGERSEREDEEKEETFFELPQGECGSESESDLELMERAPQQCGDLPGADDQLYGSSELAGPGNGGYVGEARTESTRGGGEAPGLESETSQTAYEEEHEEGSGDRRRDEQRAADSSLQADAHEERLLKMLLHQLMKETANEQAQGGRSQTRRDDSSSGPDYEGSDEGTHGDGGGGDPQYISQDLLRMARACLKGDARWPDETPARAPREEHRPREGNAQEGPQDTAAEERCAGDLHGDHEDLGGCRPGGTGQGFREQEE